MSAASVIVLHETRYSATITTDVRLYYSAFSQLDILSRAPQLTPLITYILLPASYHHHCLNAIERLLIEHLLTTTKRPNFNNACNIVVRRHLGTFPWTISTSFRTDLRKILYQIRLRVFRCIHHTLRQSPFPCSLPSAFSTTTDTFTHLSGENFDNTNVPSGTATPSTAASASSLNMIHATTHTQCCRLRIMP